MKDEIQIQIEGVNFTCYMESGRIIVVREGVNFGIWDDEIDIGHYKVSDSFPMPYDLELKSNLALYRKALDKVKKLKAFL